MKKFRCIPIAIGLPIIFSLFAFVYIGIVLFFHSVDESDGVWVGIIGFVFSLSFVVAMLPMSIKRVEIHHNTIVCKGLHPGDTFQIEYLKCNIGMDYHLQNGNKIWWIYLCYGAPPQYKHNNPANRMNAVKIQPGFVKIMYSEEVYEALIEVLPKKQKTALITARRCAGFEKPGKIVF